MNNLDKKCDLCNGYGLILKQNSSHVLCPRCEIKKIDKLNDTIDEEIKQLLTEQRAPLQVLPLTFGSTQNLSSASPLSTKTFDEIIANSPESFGTNDSDESREVAIKSEVGIARRRGRPKKELAKK